MKLEKPSKNYGNDLDECLTYIYIYVIKLFLDYNNLLSHFNQLLVRKVPKLLENYNM